MDTKLGAHEVIELHEVLNDAIHGLNTMRLYRPHARDAQLQTMMDQHMAALTNEYNSLIQMTTGEGASQTLSQRHYAKTGFQPAYGLRNPETQTPATSINDIDDVDVTTCLINCHKQTATLKMKASLEMANPTLRRAIQQGANMSADMAYESFQYANHKGYYQVPTLKDVTQHTLMNSYGTAGTTPMTQMGQFGMQ